MRRLFIDFALITKKTKVTGIPRVTYEYFKKFLDISLRRGGDWIVHPVYVEGAGNLRDGVHNLPPEIITCYLDYLQKLAVLCPERELPKLARLIGMQLSESLPGGPPVATGPLSFRRRVAQWRRETLARVASMDPVLKKLVKSHVTGKMAPDPSELPPVDQVKLVGNQFFHQSCEGDLLFMPAYWHDITPMSYFTLQQSGVMIVPMLHDLLPVIIPEKYEKAWSRHFHFNVYVTCLLADAIVSISHATRRDLGRLMESHSYTPPEIFVQYHGFDFQKARDGDSASKRFPADSNYFLMVGSIEPKKNHPVVIDQFIRVAEQHPGVRLKIIGFPGWMHEEITKKIALAIRRGHPVDYYKNVDDAELACAYGNARATIMASSHEGFGLPVIESLSLGCPVILSDIPVFREIAGDQADYFSLDHPDTLGLAMKRSLDASAARRVEDFRWPTWDDQAEVLFDWLVTRTSRNRIVYSAL
jgi:glycosyltransferase involved in cell wall biosynthesis